jgi:hypothetical protein
MTLADGSQPAKLQTRIRTKHDGARLHVLFECDDPAPWGTHTRRDDPIYEEEAVEVFIAPGMDDPEHYFEFEVSPNGVLWDGAITNASLDGSQLQVDETWDCPDVEWQVERDDSAAVWRAVLVLPLIELASGHVPAHWRANFYRIDRPLGNHNDAAGEFSCWSPTLTSPAAFHRPRRFGTLILEGI